MGVVNLTPDSFSDGGLFLDSALAIDHAYRLIDEGADVLDVGAESSRPGAKMVPAGEEIARLVPILRALRDAAVPISVDTVKPEVMRAAITEGASLINDIYALRNDGALSAVADSAVGVCLMHMRGEPATMQDSPEYGDVIGEVSKFLSERVWAAEEAGVARERICVDPGFGFGKTVEHNLKLLQSLKQFELIGLPVLFGASRKSTLGSVTGRAVDERVHASVATALLAAQNGASILRVHDVAPTKDAIAMWLAMQGKSNPTTQQLLGKPQ
ncbi:MAG: dihydropteroate synthase [Burkholderiales bacterium]